MFGLGTVAFGLSQMWRGFEKGGGGAVRLAVAGALTATVARLRLFPVKGLQFTCMLRQCATA